MKHLSINVNDIKIFLPANIENKRLMLSAILRTRLTLKHELTLVLSIQICRPNFQLPSALINLEQLFVHGANVL